jgi:hypothetical protein
LIFAWMAFCTASMPQTGKQPQPLVILSGYSFAPVRFCGLSRGSSAHDVFIINKCLMQSLTEHSPYSRPLFSPFIKLSKSVSLFTDTQRRNPLSNVPPSWPCSPTTSTNIFQQGTRESRSQGKAS